MNFDGMMESIIRDTWAKITEYSNQIEILKKKTEGQLATKELEEFLAKSKEDKIILRFEQIKTKKREEERKEQERREEEAKACECGRPKDVKTLPDGSKKHFCRFFGLFRCSSCRNRWSSGFTYPGKASIWCYLLL